MVCPTASLASAARIKQALFESRGNVAEAARISGCTRRQVYKHAAAERLGSGRHWAREKPLAAVEPGGSFSEDKYGNAEADGVSDKPIKSMEDACRAAQVDLKIWYVEKWETAAWTVPLKVGSRDTPVAIRQQQYRVKLFLKRIMPRSLMAAHDAIYERMRRHAPKYPRLAAPKIKGESFLAVFGLFDAHFGKLCWKPETGSDYDLKIAEQLYRNAVVDLLAEAKHRPVASVLLPIGNDFYHLDNRRNTTFNGTPQDVDGRYAKVFEAGKAASIWAVELLAGLAPVSVVWVPGNHDPTMSYHLASDVKSWFHNCNRVEVDNGPAARKYVAFGDTLIGLTHGDAPKPEDLPGLMATERPKEWAAATCREWLIGHQHRERQWVTKGVDTHKGTVVRVLRSLAGTDAWHFEKGYVGAGQGAEVYFYGKTRGYAGHAVAPARLAA